MDVAHACELRVDAALGCVHWLDSKQRAVDDHPMPPASITGCTYRIANERSPDCKGNGREW